jgi:cell division protein ZapA
MSDTTQLEVQILGREFRVSCPPEEKAELLAAVGYLDAKMREIRDSSKTNNTERVAVMAALNIAHELLKGRSGVGGNVFDSDDIKRRIVAMQVAIDQTMVEQDELF